MAHVKPGNPFFLFKTEICDELKGTVKGRGGIVKAAAERWKAMSDEQKRPYVEKHAALTAEYQKATGTVSKTKIEKRAAEPGTVSKPKIEKRAK